MVIKHIINQTLTLLLICSCLQENDDCVYIDFGVPAMSLICVHDKY